SAPTSGACGSRGARYDGTCAPCRREAMPQPPREPDPPSDFGPDLATSTPEPLTLGETPTKARTTPFTPINDSLEPSGTPSAADDGPEDFPARAGRYHLEAEIARGGMGVVLRARDPDVGRPLAVKVLLGKHRARADLERRFLDEARLTGQLQHPGVPPVHEIGRLYDSRP